MDRRSLLDDEPTPTDGMRNVFDDEFEVEDFDVVADGFRPGAQDEEVSDGRGQEEGLGHDNESRRSTSTIYAPGLASSPPLSRNPTRSSISKPRNHVDNPFASPDDAEPSLSFEPSHNPHRSVSSASSHLYARTDSPRFGAGPSHPYGMYQQNTLARTPSVATTSTIRPLDPPPRGGPQHPYTLYPQSVPVDIEDEISPAQNPVPLGFSGLGQPYHRQMGPDGEEQDIIGADGHAEQLPPYSRYPEDGPEKAPLLVPTAPVALHSRAPVAGTDPTMSLMHTPLLPSPQPQQAQHDREPESMTDSSGLLGRHSSISSAERRAGLAGSTSSLNSKKSWSEKSWKEKKKTKFCGIPFWWFLLGLGVLGFIGAVLGGVIGGFVEGVKRKDEVASASPTTPLYDASIVPSHYKPPPTGTYQLSLSTPQATQADCLTGLQKYAWSCDLGGVPATALDIAEEGNKTGAYLLYESNSNATYYGSQTSFMKTGSLAPFLQVVDNDDPGMGTAFFFQQFYNKLVILPARYFRSPYNDHEHNSYFDGETDEYDGNNNADNDDPYFDGNYGEDGPSPKRDIVLNDAWIQQKRLVQSGDKPWFCVWNNTFVEGFIYMQQNVAASITSTANSSSATPSPTKSTKGLSDRSSITPAPTPPDATITTTITRPSTTATYTGAMSDYADWSSSIDRKHPYFPKDQHIPYKRQTTGTTSAASSPTVASTDPYASLSAFPYMVKIEERRLPNNPNQPYCQQYQLLDDGTFSPLYNPSNSQNPIKFFLNESDPAITAYQSAGLADATRKRTPHQQIDVPGTCHCQWISGQ